MKKNTTHRLILSVLCLTTFLLYAISITTDHWRQGIGKGGKADHVIVNGLWRTCTASPAAERYECFIGEDSSEMQAWLRCCQSLAIVTLVSSFLTTVLMIPLSRKPTKSRGGVIAAFHMIGAVAFAMTLAVYVFKFDVQIKQHRLTGKVKFANFTLGWSYFVGWIAVMFASATVAFTLFLFWKTSRLSTGSLVDYHQTVSAVPEEEYSY